MYRLAKPWEDNKKKDKSDNAETMDEVKEDTQRLYYIAN